MFPRRASGFVRLRELAAFGPEPPSNDGANRSVLCLAARGQSPGRFPYFGRERAPSQFPVAQLSTSSQAFAKRRFVAEALKGDAPGRRRGRADQPPVVASGNAFD